MFEPAGVALVGDVLWGEPAVAEPLLGEVPVPVPVPEPVPVPVPVPVPLPPPPVLGVTLGVVLVELPPGAMLAFAVEASFLKLASDREAFAAVL